MLANIPGYYYDEEKKKYFKIQKNHNAPEGSKHTEDSIKRRKLDDQQAKEARELISRQQSRVRKPNSILNHLNGEILLCEMGDRVSLRASIVRDLTAGMRKRKVLPWPGFSPLITAFEYDAVGQLLFIGFSSAIQGDSTFMGEVEAIAQQKSTPNQGPTFHYTQDHVSPVSFDASEITSVCLNQNARTLLTTYMGRGLASNRIQLQSLTGGHVNDVRTLYSPGNLVIRDSTVAPASSNYLFIVASDRGILSIDSTSARNLHRMDFRDSCGRHPKGGNNYTSVEFLNEHPNVICTGKFIGSIDVFDLREGPKPTETLLHQTGVARIKCLDEHRILVQGLNKSTCQYDLRYGKEGFSKDKNTTLPFQEYPELDTGPYFSLGFDVDTESGILAAAQADCTVQIYDIASGKKLNYPDMQYKCPSKMPVKTLKFVEEKESCMKSLWVPWKSGIWSYSLSD